MQQPRVDAVALGEHFIQLHRTEYRTDIGHGQVNDRQFQVTDFISGARRIDNLNKTDRIDSDVGVIF